MQRSHASRYQLSKNVSPDGYVDISVRREDSTDWRHRSTTYTLEIVLCSTSTLDPTIFSRGPTAISLEANFDERTREISIGNIEGRALERGQAFARKTYSQLLAVTPECEAVVLYNIMDSKAEATVDRARSTPGWIIPSEGALLRALYECGFQQVVGIERGGSGYRCVRASNRRNAA